MSKLFLLILSLASLTACSMPMTDMTNNQFASVIVQPTNVAGIWTGSSGPYMVTYKFNADGTGLMCYSYQDKNVLSRVKISGNVVYGQDGLKQTIKHATSNELILHVSYFAGADARFTPDEKLENASPYCTKQLAG